MSRVHRKGEKKTAMWTPERVRALRERYSETQEEFARRFRASTQIIAFWEQGRSPVSGMGSVILDRLEADLAQEATANAG